MNEALPFFPPREPDELVKDVDYAARKLLELDGVAFDAMYEAMTGWKGMPPRQKFGFLANRIRKFDEEMQARVAMIDAELMALQMAEPGTPYPLPDGTAIPVEVYVQQLAMEREQIVTTVLPNPGVAFFQQLAGIDARKTAELTKVYVTGLKTYGGKP